MVSSVLVLEPDTDLKFDRAVYGRFFANFAVRKTAFLGKESFAQADKAPICELLLIAHQAVNSPERKVAIEALERLYGSQHLPIIHASSKDVASISEEFLTMAFGDSLTILKDKNVVKRQRALYVFARFFQNGTFPRAAYVEKLKQVCKDFPDDQIGGLIQDFASKGYIKAKGRGVYQFVGLDQKAFSKLEALGFDMDPSMYEADLKKAPVVAPALSTPTNVASISASPAPAPSVSPSVAPKGLDDLVRQEFAQLRADLEKQVELQMQKALATQKVNDRLLRLSPKELEKAQAMLELLASP